MHILKTDQAPLPFCPTAGGRWSVTESSWSPWEPSSSARPQPTPSLWISCHNHCLPGNTWPLPWDMGTHLLELRGHPESGIILLHCGMTLDILFQGWIWAEIRSHTSRQLRPCSLPAPKPWQCHGWWEEVSHHRRTPTPLPQLSTSPCLEPVGEDSSLTSL